MDTAAFVRYLYACVPVDLKAEVTVWDAKTRRSSHVAFGDTRGIVLAAAQREVQGIDSYYGVGLTHPGLTSTQKGGKLDVVALPAFWLDVDVVGPGHAAKNLPTEDQAYEIIGSCPLEPTLLVHSGGGRHAYWCVEDPWLTPPVDTATLNAQLKAFQDLFITFARDRNLHVDQTGNLDRVLRLPGTSNFKNGAARSVHLEMDGVRYRSSDLLALLKPSRAASVSATARPVALTGRSSVGTSEIAELRRRLGHVTRRDSRALVASLLAGVAYAVSNRDDATQRLTGVVAGVMSAEECRAADPARIALELFGASIAAMEAAATDPANPAPSLDVVEEKLTRALREMSVKKDAAAAERAGWAMFLGVDARDERRKAVESFCARYKVSREEFPRRLVISHNGANWILRNGIYQAPCGRDNLPMRLRDLLESWEIDPDGAAMFSISAIKPASGDKPARRKTMAEMLSDYATSPLASEGSLTLAESYYDPVTETFWEAFAPLRPIKPEFDPEIARWLELLGGDNSDKLLDWVATVTQLDAPTSAIYISGVKSAGKTMLADGLARLWSVAGVTNLKTFLSRFNASIVACPLIRASEGLPKGCTSRDIRDLVGSTNFAVERKGLPVVRVQGCPRLIIDDNDNGHLFVEPEDLGKTAHDAVALKFLHIEPDESAADYLKSLGGMPYTSSRGWVTGDRIAAHALYLRDTRAVQRGNRFLVEGASVKMARLIAMDAPAVAGVCEWLLRTFKLNAKAFNNLAPNIKIGNGSILVNTTCVYDHWSDVFSAFDPAKKPSTKFIGSALTKINTKRFKLGDVWFHEIDLELLFEFNKRVDIIDEDVVRARIDRVIPTSVPPSSSTALVSGAAPVLTVTPRGV